MAENSQKKSYSSHPQLPQSPKYFEAGDTEKQKINPELVTGDLNKTNTVSDAGEIAKCLAPQLTKHQLRRFFSEFRNLERKLKINKEFDKVLPYLKIIKSKAIYTSKRDSSKIPQDFCKFLTSNVDRIQDERDFEAFMLHFEAVLGFCYGKGLKKS